MCSFDDFKQLSRCKFLPAKKKACSYEDSKISSQKSEIVWPNNDVRKSYEENVQKGKGS